MQNCFLWTQISHQSLMSSTEEGRTEQEGRTEVRVCCNSLFVAAHKAKAPDLRHSLRLLNFLRYSLSHFLSLGATWECSPRVQIERTSEKVVETQWGEADLPAPIIVGTAGTVRLKKCSSVQELELFFRMLSSFTCCSWLHPSYFHPSYSLWLHPPSLHPPLLTFTVPAIRRGHFGFKSAQAGPAASFCKLLMSAFKFVLKASSFTFASISFRFRFFSLIFSRVSVITPLNIMRRHWRFSRSGPLSLRRPVTLVGATFWKIVVILSPEQQRRITSAAAEGPSAFGVLHNLCWADLPTHCQATHHLAEKGCPCSIMHNEIDTAARAYILRKEHVKHMRTCQTHAYMPIFVHTCCCRTQTHAQTQTHTLVHIASHHITHVGKLAHA